MTLPRMIGMSSDGNSVLIKRFTGVFRLPSSGTQAALDDLPVPRRAAVLDVETTGLDHDRDQVIEVGLRTFVWDARGGGLLEIGEHYNGLQDPGEPLSPEIVELTGLTDDKLAGQRIDWGRVAKLLDGVELIIAHNASFDRPFVDANLGPNERIWACSVDQIDWRGMGFPSARLEILSLYHGFFVHAHRALEDADALLNLLSYTEPNTDQGYLVGLRDRALRPAVQLSATGAPFATKDLLKARHYRWQPEARVWQREVSVTDLEAERAWLRAEIYGGRQRWREEPIAPHERFSR